MTISLTLWIALDGLVWQVVVTSPYLRCVETAAAICSTLGNRTRLMVDLGLGEVYGPEIFGEEPGRIIRSSCEVEAAWPCRKSKHIASEKARKSEGVIFLGGYMNNIIYNLVLILCFVLYFVCLPMSS